MSTETNPYAAPQAAVADPPPADDRPDLASRWLRLGGAIVDSVAVMLVTLPVMYVGGWWTMVMSGRQPDLAQVLGWNAFGFLAFVAVHGWLLHTSGQTLAKRMLGMKIVDMAGNKPPFLRLLGLRYFVPQALYLVPYVGGLVALVGLLLIFREDRRAMHDHFAGTQVVVAK